MSFRSLSPEECRQFRTAGYLVVRNMLAADDVRAVRSVAGTLFDRHAGREVGDFLDLVGHDQDPAAARLPQLLMPVKYAPELADSALCAAAWSVARDILGDDLEYQGEHLIAKPPRLGAETPPHQDEAFWSGGLDYDSVSIWIPLQDVREEDGCLYFVPGSHATGVRPHRPVSNDPLCNSLELTDAPEELRNEPMEVGSLSIHHCRTIHGAWPNTSATTRFAYIYGFGRPATPAVMPREFPWLSTQRTARQARAEAGGYDLTKMRPEH